jgi:acyl-[acyl-carrier-protein]-phospholipid O-acyltransferase/long-chain-fatty-acid--[acyl-carrier-protein] ligase
MATSHILCSRRFLPLFLTQFLGALNDNFFKTAVIILVTYRISEELKVPPQWLVTASGALYLLPYTVFCATAGRLADKFDKARIARVIKLAELCFMLLAAIGFAFHLVVFLFLVVFCMGAHSAFFSPAKYALLPDQLHENELMQGNAYIESGTFTAILLGTIAGGLMVQIPHGEAVVSCTVIAIALLGIASSRYILPATQCDPSVVIHFNIFRDTWESIAYVARRRMLFKSILANSWFWFIAVTFLSLFPAFTKQIIGADEDVTTLFLTSFSVGTGCGAVICGSLLKNGVSTRYVPLSAFFMSVFIFDLWLASPNSLAVHHGALLSISQFLATFYGKRMVFDLFMIACAGGFYIVPLYAVIQKQCEPSHRAQVMACNNVMNAFFMFVSAVMALVFFAFKFTVADVFLVGGILNLAAFAMLCTQWGRVQA